MPTEADAIAAGDRPATTSSIAGQLRDLGLETGSTVVVHCSLSALGWVAGGAHAVVDALQQVIGGDGTLVVPTHSGQLSDPSIWEDPPVPAAWHETIRAETPAFDAVRTPTRMMGAVADLVRALPGAVRSPHPQVSMAAVGPLATVICEAHPLAPQFGDESPLGRLYELDAEILLLGVDHANDTSLHLAEWRADWASRADSSFGAPVAVDGERRWATWTDLDADSDDFAALGDAFRATGRERAGAVGAGTGRRCRVRDIVDFGVDWISTNRR